MTSSAYRMHIRRARSPERVRGDLGPSPRPSAPPALPSSVPPGALAAWRRTVAATGRRLRPWVVLSGALACGAHTMGPDDAGLDAPSRDAPNEASVEDQRT